MSELTHTVFEYVETLQRLVSDAETPADWAPLAEFIAIGEFERVGNFCEVQDWRQYTEMLTKWASTVDAFETNVLRTSELPGLVYYEVQELHGRGDDVNVVNSMTVFAFDDSGKIRHLDVYLQQSR